MECTQIKLVIDYIEEHLKEDLDNRTLANISGYSEYHFIRLFCKYVRLTPADYIRKRRISEVVRHIGKKGCSIADIAFEYGFNSKENFTRAFKNEHNILPTEWKTANCSLRLFAPFSFEISHPQPAVSIQYLEGFSLVVYRFHEAFPPNCWNQYNAEKRSARLSGGAIVEDFGAMLWDNEKERRIYHIGIKADAAKGDLSNTVRLEIKGGLYVVVDTAPSTQHDFVSTIRSTWDWIYQVWLPNSGYHKAPGFEFESYVESSRKYTERIYIPIEKE